MGTAPGDAPAGAALFDAAVSANRESDPAGAMTCSCS